MACYCELKIKHECHETLDPFEVQYLKNACKIKFDPKKVKSDPMQMKIAADINEVKGHKIYFELSEEKIVKFFSVVSHFPQEFTNDEQEEILNLTLNMISKSEKYFVKDGRITFMVKL